MKLIIEIPDKVVKAIQNGLNYRYDILTAIANGIPITDDMISREGMRKMVAGWLLKDAYYHPYSKGKTIPTDEVYDLIDNAPTYGKESEE